MSTEATESTFSIPARVDGSMTGSEFGSSIFTVPSGDARELAILQQLELGNIPDFMRKTRLIEVANAKHRAVFEVLPDVLCIGTDDDFLRVPMNPVTAQRFCDLIGGTLPTAFLNDQIWKQADVRLDPATMPPTDKMTSTEWFIGHNAKIELQRKGQCGLVAGHKKAVVLTNNLLIPEFKHCVAIQGWHYKASGKPIQGLNPARGVYHTHVWSYVDYSHGIWVLSQKVLLDDEPVDFEVVAAGMETADLVNGAVGALRFLRYATAA